MGFLSVLLPWGILLQVLAVLHFIRRRPDTFWLWIIIFFGPPGAFIYILMEVVPDLGLLRQSFEGFGRRKRISYLEALVLQNPAAGNYEELGDLYLDEGKFARARECYDKAITPRTTDLDPVYRRGIAKIHIGEFAAAIEDLEPVTSREPKYDSHRALGLLAHAYANTGQPRDAESHFQQPPSCPRCRRPTSTTPRSWPRRSVRPRRASGPSASSPRSRPCRDTFSVASGRGSGRPARC